MTIADSVQTLGVDLRTRVKEVGSERKSKKKRCNVRFSLIKKNRAFQRSYMKVWGQKKLLRTGGVSESVGSACSGAGPYRKI